MLFLLRMMKTIEKNFCKNLKKWVDKHSKTTRAELGKNFGVSQGYISNILAGRNCGDETWRRMVSKYIGIDYDTMIGVKKESSKNIIKFESIEDEEHYNVTKKFKNQALAIEINQGLVEIESYDSDELEEFKDNVQTKLKKLRKKHKKGKVLSNNAALGEVQSREKPAS
jgi:predicted transcriptional regulator